MFDRITFDPAVMGGRACIRGMRMTVSLVVNLVANGMSTDDIVHEYPELGAEDIRQALQYASALANEEIGCFNSAAAREFWPTWACPSPPCRPCARPQLGREHSGTGELRKTNSTWINFPHGSSSV